MLTAPPLPAKPPMARQPGSSPGSILVLCQGNYCRSPMAEALLRAALGPGIRVESAGLGAREGYAPHPRAIQVMAERGIDITRSRSRQVTPAMALAADLILVMDRDQQDRCVALAPGTRGRVHLLGRWLAPGRQEIPDPLGQPDRAFQGALELIIQSVAAWGDRLRQHRGTP